MQNNNTHFDNDEIEMKDQSDDFNILPEPPKLEKFQQLPDIPKIPKMTFTVTNNKKSKIDYYKKKGIN